MQELIISLMNQFGYFGILLLIMIENIFPPIPSEVILCFGGFMTSHSSLTVVGVILSATAGSTLGAILLYFIGKLVNKEHLFKIVSGKIGKILRLKKKDIEVADAWFDKKGAGVVFFGRFIPIVRSLISIPAGMSDMPFLKFLRFTFLGTLIWNTVLTMLGSMMGENWRTIVQVINRYGMFVAFILGVAIIIGIIYFYQHRMKKSK